VLDYLAHRCMHGKKQRQPAPAVHNTGRDDHRRREQERMHDLVRLLHRAGDVDPGPVEGGQVKDQDACQHQQQPRMPCGWRARAALVGRHGGQPSERARPGWRATVSSTAWSSSVRAEVVVAVVAVVADGVLTDVVVEVDVRGSVVVVAEADPLVAVGGLLVTGAEPLWSAGPVFAEAPSSPAALPEDPPRAPESRAGAATRRVALCRRRRPGDDPVALDHSPRQDRGEVGVGVVVTEAPARSA